MATMVGAHENSLRLLGALVTLESAPRQRQTIQLTTIGMHLSGGADKSLKAWAIFEGEMLWLPRDGF